MAILQQFKPYPLTFCPKRLSHERRVQPQLAETISDNGFLLLLFSAQLILQGVMGFIPKLKKL